MYRILVVDDSAVDRLWVGGLLEDQLAAQVTYAENGAAAIESLSRDVPDLVVTDLQMAPINGLELVEQIRSKYPPLPVILMTAHGSEDIALEALKKGAASYVPKRKLAEDLKDTIAGVLEYLQADQHAQLALELVTRTEQEFQLGNDLACIPPLIAYLSKRLEGLSWSDRTTLIHLAVALREALVNAIEHGNLEASSQLRQGDGSAYHALAQARRSQSPYCERQVRVTVRETRSQVTYVIRNEGPGFDPSLLPDPTDPENLELASGRGLLLIRTFMNEVYHEDSGRSITMVLRK